MEENTENKKETTRSFLLGAIGCGLTYYLIALFIVIFISELLVATGLIVPFNQL